MSLRNLSPRQLATWSDDVFRAALQERPLPAGHPLSWGAIHGYAETAAVFAKPVFSDTALASHPEEQV